MARVSSTKPGQAAVGSSDGPHGNQSWSLYVAGGRKDLSGSPGAFQPPQHHRITPSVMSGQIKPMIDGLSRKDKKIGGETSQRDTYVVWGLPFAVNPLDSKKYLPQTPNNRYFTTVSKLIKTNIKIITKKIQVATVAKQTLYQKAGSRSISPAESLLVIHKARHQWLRNAHDDPMSLVS